jgi:hypothetical protein
MRTLPYPKVRSDGMCSLHAHGGKWREALTWGVGKTLLGNDAQTSHPRRRCSCSAFREKLALDDERRFSMGMLIGGSKAGERFTNLIRMVPGNDLSGIA